MKHEYTDTKLQAAIDEACDKLAQSTRVYLNALDLDNTTESWPVEAPARLDLIKSALAALPEPMDEESMLLNLLAVIHRDGGHHQAKHGTRKAVESACKEWQRLISIVEKTGQTEPKQSLSQLRPLAEAGAVPEGCLRFYTYKKDGEWTPATKHRAMQDTHYIDTRLSEPSEKPDPYAELKAAHAAGKMIQINCCTVEHPNWIDLPSPAFFGKPHEYRIKPETETFEAHGKIWTKHKPGDPMPCDGFSAVMALLGDGTFCTQQAEDWNWDNRDSTFDIIGWRYADKPLVTKSISPPTWTPAVGDVVTLKSGGPKMTVVKLADAESDLSAFLCEWFSDSGKYDSGVIYLTSLQPA